MGMKIFAARTWKKLPVWLPVLLLLTGCATPKIDWQGRVGDYTYDQAVVELGPPDKYARLTNGTMVADWLTRRARTIIAPEPYYGSRGYYYGTPAPMHTETYFPARYLRLTFDADGKLKTWKEVGG
jgi:hypothetical protein